MFGEFFGFDGMDSKTDLGVDYLAEKAEKMAPGGRK